VLRYRLMDVDSIFQQGYAYTLATLCILKPVLWTDLLRWEIR